MQRAFRSQFDDSLGYWIKSLWNGHQISQNETSKYVPSIIQPLNAGLIEKNGRKQFWCGSSSPWARFAATVIIIRCPRVAYHYRRTRHWLRTGERDPVRKRQWLTMVRVWGCGTRNDVNNVYGPCWSLFGYELRAGGERAFFMPVGRSCLYHHLSTRLTPGRSD